MSVFQTIVGLDFGSHGMKAAWLQYRSGELSLLRTELLALPDNPAEAEPLIQPWIARHEIDRLPCAIALNGSQTVFQPGRLSPDDPRTPAQAAEMEVATFNDLAGDRMMHDVTAFDWEPGLRQYLIAMARPAFVHRVLTQANAYGLRVVDLIPAPVAVFNWQTRGTADSNQPLLHIHVGHNHTELAIGVSRGLLFARSVAMGSGSFTQAIAQARTLRPAQAETLKRSDGSLAPDTPLAETLLPVADRWAAQVASGLAVYKSQFPDKRFDLGGILISGGGARLPGLIEHLQARLALPLASVQSVGIPSAPPAFELACGLALGALDAAPVQLTLLPQRLRNEVIFRVKKPYWVAAGIVGALTLGVFTISGLRGLKRESDELRSESAELQQLERAAQNIERQRRREQQVRRNIQPLREILLSGPLTRDLVSLVARSIHPDDWISMICDERSYTRPPTGGVATRVAPRRLPGMRDLGAGRPPEPTTRTTPLIPPMRVFIVEGYTPDPSLVSIKALISRLQRARMVAKADLLGDDRVLAARWLENETPPATMTNLTHFVVRVELRTP